MYQILYVSNDNLLKNASLKERIFNLLEANNSTSIFIFNTMFNNNEIEELDLESIRNVISRWEYVAYKEIDVRDYFIDKSIAEFILLVIANSNLNVQRISEILIKLKIPGYTLEKLLRSIDTNASQQKIRNFQQVFLKIDEKSIDDVYGKISASIDNVLKNEYLNRYEVSVSPDAEANFINNNIEILRLSIQNSLESLNGKVPESSKTLSFKRSFIDDLDNCESIFKQFWIGHLVNQFKIEVVSKNILAKVHKREVISNKTTTVNEVLTHIKRVKVKTDTIIGYKRSFYGVKDSSKYTEFLNQLKNKLEIENNGHIILAIDSSLIRINVESVKIFVSSVSLGEFVKSKVIDKDEKENFQIKVGQETKVLLTQEELESYIDRRIRRISIEVNYKVHISKDKIGNYITFVK